MRLPPLSSRSSLLLVIAGAVLPGVLLTGLLVCRTVRDSRAAIERRLLDTTRVDAESLDREFDGTVRVLQALAGSPALDRGDLHAFYDDARRTVRAERGWFAVILLSPDGQQLVDTGVPFGTPLPYAVEPASLTRVRTVDGPVVGTLRRGSRDGTLRFAVRVPVERGGNLRYVLSTVMEPEALNGLVTSTLPESEEWTRAIVDADGVVVARSRDAARYVGQRVSPSVKDAIGRMPRAVFREASMEGLPVYGAAARGRYGWTAAVAVPRAFLEAPLRNSVTALVGGAALLVCGGGIVVVIFSRRLSRARDAQAEAEHASQAKDQFLAVLGHELRNPLAPAVTALELMKLRGGDVMKRERDVLERQLSHMARLIDDLMDVSRLSRGKIALNPRRIELRTAIDRAVDMAQPLIAQHGHALRVDVPDSGLPLDADEDRLVQILVNLLTNAAKYTPRGGHIVLDARRDGARVTIACEDDGPGIAADLVPTMFEPFSQGPRSLDRREGGLGLGLALARSLAELHGGRIDVEPVHPHGSRFLVRLPLASGDLAAAAPAPSPIPVVARRVLLVDDNVDASEMLQLALERAGHVVCTAATGVDACDLAIAFSPEVAVLDIGLPGMTGYELARRLRALDPRIRLIALTGYGQPSDADAARRAGFDAHCTKPVTVDALLEHISALAATVSV